MSLLLAMVAIGPDLEARGAGIGSVKNIVLVHGTHEDGSAWRGVYNILKNDGYHVSVVQQPLTGLSDDVAATQRVIDQQDGPVILVGHSYGGAIITVAGSDPKVRALVYVAAMQPDVGESTNQLVASTPGEVPSSDVKLTKDGFIFIDPNKFAAEVGTDLPRAQAEYMANSQMPVAASAFNTPLTVAAWHEKPSYGIIATKDRVLSPKLARWMYKRSEAKIVEIKANHLVNVSQPRAVARVIEAAAHSAGEKQLSGHSFAIDAGQKDRRSGRRLDRPPASREGHLTFQDVKCLVLTVVDVGRGVLPFLPTTSINANCPCVSSPVARKVNNEPLYQTRNGIVTPNWCSSSRSPFRGTKPRFWLLTNCMSGPDAVSNGGLGRSVHKIRETPNSILGFEPKRPQVGSQCPQPRC